MGAIFKINFKFGKNYTRPISIINVIEKTTNGKTYSIIFGLCSLKFDMVWNLFELVLLEIQVNTLFRWVDTLVTDSD